MTAIAGVGDAAEATSTASKQVPTKDAVLVRISKQYPGPPNVTGSEVKSRLNALAILGATTVEPKIKLTAALRVARDTRSQPMILGSAVHESTHKGSQHQVCSDK